MKHTFDNLPDGCTHAMIDDQFPPDPPEPEPKHYAEAREQIAAIHPYGSVPETTYDEVVELLDTIGVDEYPDWMWQMEALDGTGKSIWGITPTEKELIELKGQCESWVASYVYFLALQEAEAE